MQFSKEHIVGILAGIISAFSVVIAAYIQFIDADRARNMAEIDHYNAMRQKEVVTEFSKKLEALEAKLTDSKDKVEATTVGAKFKEIEQRIEQVSQQTLALRQAINPIKPDEVLTIARLKDEVSALKIDFEQVEKSLVREMEVFQKSVLREAKASNSATNLILVVLIPLVLNFLYTLWKDLKAEKGSTSEAT